MPAMNAVPAVRIVCTGDTPPAGRARRRDGAHPHPGRVVLVAEFWWGDRGWEAHDHRTGTTTADPLAAEGYEGSPFTGPVTVACPACRRRLTAREWPTLKATLTAAWNAGVTEVDDERLHSLAAEVGLRAMGQQMDERAQTDRR